mmetsp:Transcript_25906/g.35758  ORF Transcript_25906/g.35758 Transcript_25906/m.35758 type:complete len:360 (-) Transcript_25906:101-1180(-)|eukprot:CAMPEP_0196587998 /NCGR_PEP_ID=MMETSP1081-20130531/59258_1 /TAXON_ID=36882 /ORGANISM="Pyramimonas amylifera, Strain CCMP720" /LENGTH=359 /DNA_ID=CAMNT_0041910355 /DNA_START=124 /DNA_END=1203 /DNA_ORIENTATION=-
MGNVESNAPGTLEEPIIEQNEEPKWPFADWNEFLQRPFSFSLVPDSLKKSDSCSSDPFSSQPGSPSGLPPSALPLPLPLTQVAEYIHPWRPNPDQAQAIASGKYENVCLRLASLPPDPAKHAPRLRLLMFPPACASASCYNHLVKDFPPSIQVWVAEYPGHGGRAGEQPAANMDVITQELMGAVSPLLDLPVVFFGHSMGSHVMYILAQQLFRAGCPIPIHLIASGRIPPHRTHPDQRDMVESGQVREMMERRMAEWGWSAERLGPTLYVAQLELLLACCRNLATPCQPTSLPTPITVYWGEYDLVDSSFVSSWAELSATSQYVFKEFQGGHFYLNEGVAVVSKVKKHLQDDCMKYFND